jgi:hypothetical protein
MSRECMDSLTIMNIAQKYRDTVKGKQPIETVMFYDSGYELLPGEIPSFPNIDKNCLVKIGFNNKSNKPNDFLFYNNKGENIYWGRKWEKDGEKK